MGDPAARLLRLLSLFQAQPRWRGAELAERLAVTERTVRRDVARLRDIGYPVDAAPGTDGGYQLGAGGRLPPLLLDDDEAVAIAVSLALSTGGAVEGIERAALAALAKIDRLLAPHLRARVRALATATMRLAPETDVVDAATVVAIAQAVDTREVLVVTYRDREGQRSERRLEPYRLGTTGRRWYLAARDVDRSTWRTFRVDRIETVRGSGHRFEPEAPPGGDVDALLAESITTAPYRFQAKVVVELSARALRRRIPPTVGVVTNVADHRERSLLTVGSDSLDALLGHLVELGAPFDVLEPAELRHRVDEARQHLRFREQ